MPITASDVRKLYDARSKLDSRANELLRDMRSAHDKAKDEKRDFTPEEQANYDQLMQDRNALSRELESMNFEISLAERASMQATMERIFKNSPDDEEAESKVLYLRAFNSFLRGGVSNLSPEHRAALMEKRAQSVGVGSEGGFTANDELASSIIEAMRFIGGVREHANVINRSRGTDFLVPLLDDTPNVATIVGENGSVAENDRVFGQQTITTFKYGDLIKVSLELLQDSQYDIAGVLTRSMGRAFGKGTNAHFTTGTGSGQPQGFIGPAPAGVTTAAATAFTYEEIIDLVHSVDPDYRQPGEIRFMMNDAIIGAIRKLQDTAGNPIWTPGLTGSDPDTLLGYPISVNQDMVSTIATGQFTMAFGNFFEGYMISQVMGLSIRRLDELFIQNGQVGFIGFMRTGGNTVFANASTYAPIKKMVQA